MPTYTFNLDIQLWTGEYDHTQILVFLVSFIIDGKRTVLYIQVYDLEVMVAAEYHLRKK